MRLEAKHFHLAGACICFSLVAQAFQALCVIFWFPETQTAAADYAVRLGWLAAQDMLTLRHEFWGSFTGAIYFPLLLSGLIARTCFAIATWNAGPGWLRLASIAFAITALRTFGRLLSSYTGVAWLDFLDSFALYLVLVFLTNGMLAIWLFKRASTVELSRTS